MARMGDHVEGQFGAVRFTGIVKTVRQYPGSGYQNVTVIRDDGTGETDTFSDSIRPTGQPSRLCECDAGGKVPHVHPPPRGEAGATETHVNYVVEARQPGKAWVVPVYNGGDNQEYGQSQYESWLASKRASDTEMEYRFVRRTADEPVRHAGGEAADLVEGSYRCTECGHGKKLYAYAGANAWGPLAANGAELAEHWEVDEWGIHEDSIQCGDHPGAWLESFVDGQWCRWWSCPKCHGGGRYTYDSQYGQQHTTTCERETPFPARHIGATGQTTVHEGWLPAAGHEAATARATVPTGGAAAS